MDSEARHAAVHGAAKSRIWLNDWTELNWTELMPTESIMQSKVVVFAGKITSREILDRINFPWNTVSARSYTPHA